MKSVKLSELIEALEFDFEEIRALVDLENGCVVKVQRSVLSDVEVGDEEALSDVPDWQKDEVEIARAIVEDLGTRFISPLDKHEFHEYGQMERFIETVRNAGAADQLWRAIKGKGAFRHFKDTADRLGLLNQWFQYRDNAMKEFVVDWAEDNNVPYEDDVKD